MNTSQRAEQRRVGAQAEEGTVWASWALGTLWPCTSGQACSLEKHATRLGLSLPWSCSSSVKQRPGPVLENTEPMEFRSHRVFLIAGFGWGWS